MIGVKGKKKGITFYFATKQARSHCRHTQKTQVDLFFKKNKKQRAYFFV